MTAFCDLIDAIDDLPEVEFDPAELERDAVFEAEYAEWVGGHEEPVSDAEIDAMYQELLTRSGVPY